ncbi:MAG TPA: aminotransferase class V-fold PLP-dependent enzyme [Actinomycetes bacterium]|jgi:selenocysteine lyase/cysteine desulfurase|nr:aminotransferase class V-fold PLP-dependent enzyme [Actinomycetes bacterium]
MAMATDRFRREFELHESSVWLNTAHQGRLPCRAALALAEAVQWKLHPEMLATSERFSEVPSRLRRALGRVLGAREDEIVLANSASYGLHLVANGLDLGPADEVVVAANDFPSDILPWLLLRDRGVTVRMIEPQDEMLTPDEVEAALTHRTRVVCLTWVHSFSGRVVDLQGVGRACRSRGAWFVVNGSQAVGAMPIDVQGLPVDALVSVGFKWLCGPYGTGVCWLQPELSDVLRPTKLYWLSALTAEDLAAPSLDLESITPRGTGRLDVFATANFFNYVPFTAALELLLELGIDEVAAYVDGLVVRLLDGIDRARFRLVSEEDVRSSLVVVEPLGEASGEVFERLAAAGVHVAHRRGRIRISPHLYNTPDEIDRALELL